MGFLGVFFLPVIQIKQLNEKNNSAITNCIVFFNFELGNDFNKQERRTTGPACL